MANRRQPAASGKIMYRIGPDGRLSSVDAEAAESEAIEVTQRIVTATLIDGGCNITVGSTATIGGERIVNRTVDFTDEELIDRVMDALEAIQEAVGDALDIAVTEDARADVAFAARGDAEGDK